MAHALLAPSSASRWLSCTPSARLEADFPDSSSAAADEGTLAHLLAELELGLFFNHISSETYRVELDKACKSKYYSDDMFDRVSDYAGYVIEQYNDIESQSRGAHVFLERRYDMTEWVPEGFGTGDVSIVGDRVLRFIDLKYGRGVKVSAIENKQLMLYGLAAYRELSVMYDIDEIHLTIYQPRLDHIETYEISAAELLEWGEKVLKPRAAMAWKGEGVQKVGDHCRFCKAAARCRALADHNLAIETNAFKQAELLSVEEVADVLTRIDTLQLWANAVAKFALVEALRGVELPGWKVVEGRSQRKITDEAAAIEKLTAAGFDETDVTNTKLKGIGDLEKYLKKPVFNELIGDLVVKPTGAPTLVPVTDKRPVFNSPEQDFSEFICKM